VHINEPGRTDWEGFVTATRAAAAGGITLLVEMPLNSSPVTVSVKALEEKRKAAEGKLSVNVGFYGGIVPGNKGDILSLAKAGVLGFKCFLVHSGIDEFPNVTEKDLDEAMPIIAKTGLPLLAHCELESTIPNNKIDGDAGNYQEYVSGRPGKWELDAIDMMIDLSRKYGCRLHIVHVSFAGALPSIRRAKAEGLSVTAETCPHYILFDSESIPDRNTLFKCAPPIRDRANNDLLIEALADGTLDFIGSDHSPATPDIKELESGDLKKAWGGIAGLQFLLSSSWTALRSRMSPEQFIPLITSHPASFLSLMDRGEIREGAPADIVIWNPDESFFVDPATILHRHKISPYAGLHLYGRVHQTLVNGSVVYDNGALSEGQGRLIP
jgi:allantoinase